jgi:hypothetical protein
MDIGTFQSASFHKHQDEPFFTDDITDSPIKNSADMPDEGAA